MKHRILIATAASIAFVTVFVLSAFGQELKPVQLPEPKLDPSKSLVQALKDRKTSREYSGDKLPEQTLSNLLWAAWGINRADSGKRTAPSAVNWQETDVYVSTTQGMYLYDPKGNALIPVVPGDLRPLTYTQVDRFKDAPLNLVYVADFQKMGDADEARKVMLASMDTGFIAENVYLYCASENLPTCFRVSIDKEKLGQALKLRPTQRIMGAQSVGLPKGK
ncbi:MAG TPA: SagB/ThcOx family dehydrogenase [Desulfomonilaceae bacterium]|nr:SagB/ThcOx family dehydrogenase [Desulfomonilaceae bacterium]HVN79500.1 SagB/ThcOx family dehydrogenase [Terriglobia bacterium]